MKYLRWIIPDHGVEFTVNLTGEGKLPTYSPEMLKGLQYSPGDKSQIQSPLQYVELRARGCLTLKAVLFQNEQTLIQATLDLTDFAFLIDGQLHEQATRLFPESLSRRPALALLQPSQLIERFRLLPSESLPHSWIRRILTLMQCSVPSDTRTTYRINESDTFGRYIAIYKSLVPKEPLVLHKQRSRYIYTPYQRTIAGGVSLRCTPDDRQWQVSLDSKGLSALQLNIQTILTLQTENNPITQEHIDLHLKRRKLFRLSNSDRQLIVKHWDDKLRVDVMPWQPFGS